MTTEMTMNEAKTEAFVGKVLTDTSGTVVTLLAAIGDRVGLFSALAGAGAVTSEALAERTGLNERYVREWLAAMASAGYIEYDPSDARFTLPPEHAVALAQERGPEFFGGVHQEILGVLPAIPYVIQAFKGGGGVPQSAYGNDFWEGLERFTAGWFEYLLLPVWIPSLPEVQQKLERGVLVADVGCGGGLALIKLAQAYPNSRFVGYDIAEPQIARARTNAEAAGVADRITFKRTDAVQGLPETYDLITTFDVVHDAVDPRGLLCAIRQALKPDGVYLCLDINCSDRLEENAGPIGAMLYSISPLYCMTVSLAGGGEGLGTMGLPESKLRELATSAGFSSVRLVPLEDPFNNLYEVR
ncbi:MAG: class I SAM-dependent methyltransferase [Dehalococcoidia bacterium]